MTQSYAPQRKLLLSHEAARPIEGVLIGRKKPKEDPGRQAALSIPDSVRALGEPLGPFFEACGGRSILSLTVERHGETTSPKTYVFEQPFVLIGRCPEGDLTLTDSSIGFRHLYLQLVAGRWSFINLARVSHVASAADEERVSGWFEPGDVLRAGPYRIRRLPAQEESSPRGKASAARSATGLLPVELEMINGLSESRRSRIRTLTSAITLIGASRQCELWLRDESVSGIHAAVVLTPDGAWVVDLLGRDGVVVDDQRVYWKQIRDGNELQVGRFRFRVHVGTERKRSPRRSARRRRPEGNSAEHDRLNGGSLTGHSVLALVRQLAEMQNQFFEHSQLQMQLMSEMVAHLRGNEQASVRRDLARIDEIGRELRDIQIQLATGSAARPAPDSATVDVDVDPPARSADASSLRPAAIEDQRGKTPPKPPAYIAFSAAETASNESDAAAAVDSEALQPDRDLTREPVNARDPVIGDRSEESLEFVDSPDVEESNDFEKSSEADFDIAEDSAAPAPVEAFADEVPSEESPDEPEASPRQTSPRGGSDDAHDRLTRRMARLAQERNSRWRKVLQAFRRKSSN